MRVTSMSVEPRRDRTTRAAVSELFSVRFRFAVRDRTWDEIVIELWPLYRLRVLCVLLRRPVHNSMSDDAVQFNYAYARRPFEVLHCPSDL